MERVPRDAFVGTAHAALAARDLPVPIASGQTASPAWLVAALFEALAVEEGQRVLQVGAGSGYGTAILGRLGAEVLALERVSSLADAAGARCAALGIAGVVVRWADGSQGAPGQGGYDRIVVHACCDPVPAALLDRLAPGGMLVCTRPAGAGQGIARITAGGEQRGLAPFHGCRLPPLRCGLLDL